MELPFDPDHVCYVWFDALISYLSGAGYPDDPAFAGRWAVAQHLIGKDILKPHAIFWPIMLKAMGLEPYRHLDVHGYWNVDDRKISKSLGNMVSPLAMRDQYGFEAFRYFLLREMSFGLDASFTEEALVARVNADLANNLGNLVSRTLNMTARYCDGAVPEPGPGGAPEEELAAAARAAAAEVDRLVPVLEPSRALEGLWRLVNEANRYLDGRAPWKAAKDPARDGEVRTALYTSCQVLRAIALLLAPFMPATATEILARLGMPDALRGAALPDDVAHWHGVAPGTPTTRGAPLFPRIEPPEAA